MLKFLKTTVAMAKDSGGQTVQEIVSNMNALSIVSRVSKNHGINDRNDRKKKHSDDVDTDELNNVRRHCDVTKTSSTSSSTSSASPNRNSVAAVSPRDVVLTDDALLGRVLAELSPGERCVAAQVCRRWRRAVESDPDHWRQLLPIVSYRDATDRVLVQYASLERRGFDSVCLLGARDDDVDEFVAYCGTFGREQFTSLALRCSIVSDGGLERLVDTLTSVVELELTSCNEITESGLWSVLRPRIKHLTIADCINVADDSVRAIAQLLPSLHELNIQAYHVTDGALAFFSPSARGAPGSGCSLLSPGGAGGAPPPLTTSALRVLRLTSCWEITNHGVVNICHALPNLVTLSLSGCSKVTDDGVELIAENLRLLRHLDLSWCPRITDQALEFIACDLAYLEELILDRCVHVTDMGVGYVSTMSTLVTLSLRWCCQLGDLGLQHVYTMVNLRTLYLAGCTLLSSGGLIGLIQLKNLDELEVTNCPGASVDLCEYIEQHLPRCQLIR